MISEHEKRDIFESAKAQLVSWYGDDLAQRGACLYWAQVTLKELTMRGHRAVLQAGDMLWRIVPEELDKDGTIATHFGYQWSPEEPFSQEALAAGLLPEVHIWAALPDDGQLVDFCTAHLPRIAKQDHGFDWGTALPPEYIFGVPPRDAFYRPHLAAIKFVWGFILEKVAA